VENKNAFNYYNFNSGTYFWCSAIIRRTRSNIVCHRSVISQCAPLLACDFGKEKPGKAVRDQCHCNVISMFCPRLLLSHEKCPVNKLIRIFFRRVKTGVLRHSPGIVRQHGNKS
jgi:hypothetical protein